MANPKQTQPDRSNSTSPNPSGGRPRGPEHLASENAAAAFAGLPEGDTHKEIGDLLDDVGDQLGWPAKLVNHFKFLLERTRPQDWLPGAHPIVWLSVRETAIELGISKSQVRRNEKKMHELGAISWKDSGNHRRFGYRDRAGNIVRAFGIDLSPAGALLPLLRETAAAGTNTDRKNARLDVKSARRSILAIIGTARKDGLLPETTAEAWKRLVLEATHGHDSAQLPTLTAQLRRLEAMDTELRKELDAIPGHGETDSGCSRDSTAQPVDNSAFGRNLDATASQNESPGFQFGKPPYDYPTTEPVCENITVARDAGRKGKTGSETRPDAAAYRYTGDDTVGGVPVPAFLAILPDPIRERMPPRGDIWPAIVDAAADLAADIGVSRHAWSDACLDLGPERAAVALTIVAIKHQRGIVYSPGGYFRQMTRRHATGELHLRPSVFGLLPEEWRDRKGARGGRERLQ